VSLLEAKLKIIYIIFISNEVVEDVLKNFRDSIRESSCSVVINICKKNDRSYILALELYDYEL